MASISWFLGRSNPDQTPSPLLQEKPEDVKAEASSPVQLASSSSSLSESNEASYLQWTTDVYKQWFVDSGRPEKGQKYVLSLNRSIDTLKSSGYDLGRLGERVEEASSSKLGWSGYYFSGTLEYFWPCGPQSFTHFAYAALKALDSPDQYTDRYQNTNVRLQYADFLQNLRNALTSPDYLERRADLDPALVELLETLCYDKFTNTYLFNYWQALLLQLCGEIPEGLDFTAFSHLLTEHNEKLEHSPAELRKESFILNYEKLQGTIGASFDPVGRSNVPKKRSEQTIDSQDGRWTMTRIAHGTPTLEKNAITKICRYTFGCYNAEIIPEYKAFLRAAKARGERVFYANLQKTKAWQTERDRSLVIEQLQEDPEFQETFYAMALPMDGSEFSNLIKKQVPTEEFKKNLLALFFNDENQLTQQTAKLPRDLLQRIEKNPELASKVADHMRYLINQVHVLYFENEELATNKDRQDFIMQFYSDLTDYMISMEYKRQDTGLPLQEHERIRYVVQACKDNKDRGGAKNGIDEAKYILLTYPLDDPQALHEALYDVYINTLGAYTIKFEEILPNRLVYFTSLMQRYGELAKDPTKIQKIRDAQPDYFKVREHRSARAFDKTPISSIPTVETALTRADYMKALKAVPEISIELPLDREPASEKLAEQMLSLAQTHFAPRYADISFSLPKINSELASLLKGLKEVHQEEGSQAIVTLIQEIFDHEDDWKDLSGKKEVLYKDHTSPFVQEVKEFCDTPERKNDFLNLLNLAIDQGHLNLNKTDLLPEDFIPSQTYNLEPTQIKTDPLDARLTLHQDLDLVDSQGITHGQIQLLFKKEEAKATIALKTK